jgi:hypothetical protein
VRKYPAGRLPASHRWDHGFRLIFGSRTLSDGRMVDQRSGKPRYRKTVAQSAQRRAWRLQVRT